MPRYKLTIEYDGSKFFGFQKQKKQISVQETLEAAISKLAVNPVEIYCAGRTDAGVHATAQVIHFDLDRNMTGNQIMNAINFHLHNEFVSVTEATNLGENSTFHARFSALQRWYEYLILIQQHSPTFNRHLYWWLKKDLNIKNMQDAASYLIGTHDFTSFRSKGCAAKSPVKTINEITITKDNNVVKLRIKAPSFLYHQVRNMVGALVLVGQNKLQPQDIKDMLEAKNTAVRKNMAKANGLYLINVVY